MYLALNLICIDNIKYFEIKDIKELNFKSMICNQNTGPPVYIPFCIYIFLWILRKYTYIYVYIYVYIL